MSEPTGDLAGFAYGEDLEGVSLRSLGYRLLAPLRGEAWCDEVEALCAACKRRRTPITGRRPISSAPCCWPTAGALSR